MPQSHPYSRRVLRSRRRKWIRRNLRAVAVLTTGAAALFLIITVWLIKTMPSTSFAWWLLGAFHASVVAAYGFLLHSGFMAFDSEAIRHVRGAWGEDNTRNELQRARRQRIVWGWVDSVTLQNGDIDHLVITRRGGLIAIDSKWRNQIHDREEMARAARKVRLRAEAFTRDLLKGDTRGSRRARVNPLSVRSIVVVWGAAQHDVPDGAEVDGIAFVPGRRLVAWLGELDGDVVDKTAASQLMREVERRRVDVGKAQGVAGPRRP